MRIPGFDLLKIGDFMRLGEEKNNYLELFTEQAEKNGLVEDLKTLYFHEKTAGDLETAGAIMALIPFVDRCERLVQRGHDMHLDQLRENVSEKLLETVEAIKPKEFASWRDVRDFDQFLHLVDGSMLAVKEREVFQNLRQRSRIEWQQRVASEGESRQQVLLTQMKHEQEQQETYRKTMHDFITQTNYAQERASQKLTQLATTQHAKFSDLNENMQSVKKILSEQGIQIDQHTFLLLQSDAELSAEIRAVADYLQLQENQAQAQLQSQQRVANYQGVLDGFGLIAAISQRMKNPMLEKIGGMCTQVVLIHKAMTDLPKLASVAVLSPYAAIGMAILNIAAIFKKSGSNSHPIILKQFEKISKQIECMHRDMKERFVDIHHHLNRIEQVIIRGFKQITYLVTAPLTRRLDEIHIELQQLTYLVQQGFHDLFLKDLSDCLAHVNSYIEGITPSVSADKPQEWLVTLANWVKERSYHRQFTGMTLFNEQEGQRVLSISPKRLTTVLQSAHPDGRSVINIFFIVAIDQNWISRLVDPVPHTGIWFQALSMYLTLRYYYVNTLGKEYDPKFLELDQIYAKTQQGINSLVELSTSELVVSGLFKKIHDLYVALLNQYQQFRVVYQSSEASIVCSISKQYSFNYATVVKQHKGHQRDFTAANGLSQEDCLSLIQKTAEQQGLSIFHQEFLLAEKAGLIEFRCRMHRSMKRDKQHKYKTEGKLYGLEIILYVRETQQQFVLTQPTKGYAKYYSAHDHTKASIESHKKALPEKTIFLKTNIDLALTIVRRLLDRYVKESQQPFYQRLSNVLLLEHSLANELLMYLQLGKIMSRFSCFNYREFDYDQTIGEVNKLLHFCSENTSAAQVAINQFFDKLPNLIANLTYDVIPFSMESSNFPSLEDLFRGERMLLEFSKNQQGFFVANCHANSPTSHQIHHLMQPHMT